jgi:hypothetical protein
LRERRATSPPVPHAERRVAACSFRCAPPPSPAAPTQATPAKLSCPVLNAPALSRLQCGTCTAPTLGAGWCRVTPTSRGSTVSSFARLLRCLDQIPTASLSSRHNHGPQGHPFSRRPPSCFRLRSASFAVTRRTLAGQVGVTRQNVAKGHFHRAPNFWLSSPRAQEKKEERSVSALLRELLINKGDPPATRWTPARFRVSSLHRLRKATPHLAPERRPDAAPSARPPGSRCLRPCKPSVLSAVSACRRFQDQRSPPTTLDQTPSAFQVARRCTESHFRGAPQRSAELLPLFRSGTPLRWIPGPSQKSTLRRETQLLPRRPRSGFLPHSRRREMTAANRSAK